MSKADEEHAFDGAPDAVFLGTGGAGSMSSFGEFAGPKRMLVLAGVAAILYIVFFRKGARF